MDFKIMYIYYVIVFKFNKHTHLIIITSSSGELITTFGNCFFIHDINDSGLKYVF